MLLNKENLHAYQQTAVKFILDNPNCGLFLEQGLGKTISALTAIEYLLDELAVFKVLIVAPLRVAHSVWSQEAQHWRHTQKLECSRILGTPKERLAAMRSTKPIHIINIDNFVWLVQQLGKCWNYDMVVFDESTLFKSRSSRRFKAARSVLPRLKRTVILSGTPAPNGLIDLWSQLFLLDRGQRLYKTITQFRNLYFDVDYFGYNYTPKPEAEEKIHARIDDICLSMSNADYLDLPDKIETIVDAELPPGAATAYKVLRKDLLLELENDEINAMNAAVLCGKCLQLTNGNLYLDESGRYEVMHTAKLEALSDIIEEAAGAPVLCFYQFKSDLAEIRKRFKKAVFLDKKDNTIARWNQGKIPLLLAHPASCGHGLNLQQGGSICVWYGLNYNLELFQQANARLHRQGQTRPVFIYYILAKNTIDFAVKKALDAKCKTQRALLEYLK